MAQYRAIGPYRHPARSIGLFTDNDYGARLTDLVQYGLPMIHPGSVVGTIAFPSYHTVMALLVVWYLRGTSIAIPALAVNVTMVPAILAHGGHHLSDMGGGVAVFVLAATIASRLSPAPKSAR